MRETIAGSIKEVRREIMTLRNENERTSIDIRYKAANKPDIKVFLFIYFFSEFFFDFFF